MTTKLYTTNHLEYGEIPYTEGVVIDRNGTILLQDGSPLKLFKKKTGYYVNLPIKGMGSITVNLATLTSIVFKGCQLHWKYWTQIRLYFKDGNCFNVDPSNIAHQIYPENFSVKYKEVTYKIIPNFTGYGISRNGHVLNLKSKRLLTLSEYRSKYKGFSLSSDIHRGNTSTSRHRILCLTYKEYPKDMDNMDVNHINGIQGDDDLDNLEWVTKARNTQHVVENGLVSNTKRFFSLDVSTGEVTKWRSLNHCADTLGVDRLTIYQELRDKKVTQVLAPHHRYAYDDGEEIIWPTEPPSRMDMIKRGTLKLFDSNNNLVWEGVNFKELAESSFGEMAKNVARAGTSKMENTIFLKRFKRSGSLKVIPDHKLEIHLANFICDGETIRQGSNTWQVEKMKS